MRRSPPALLDDETGLERLIFFSDAVFAIAITLLVLEIRLPVDIANLSDAALLAQLAAVKARILAYVISFLVIGVFWMGHHSKFRQIRRYDRRLMWINLLVLMSVAFMPFPTEVIAESGNRASTIFYALAVALVGLLSAAEYVYASRAGLLDPEVTPGEVRAETLLTLLGAAVFLLSCPVALINADLGKYFWLLLLPLSAAARSGVRVSLK